MTQNNNQLFSNSSSITLTPSLECPEGQLIQVEYANYGRKVGQQICPDPTVTVSYIIGKNITLQMSLYVI